ncbi:hypothetical protein NEUTE1DRAFT_102116 [Neurospora tetrasperma FGSC 2508]|uniref:Uncharacterized protein n=1 Tax=Neurospora tetrasperma (strain FGSC 2508 / ATCC MYA-4615 / P0657) TaxID=510951 RepID=F8MRA0_NEUT8|nr:uncharacterized protein NEUTE1DRAFT_102116 [Neurospora tetrasperma FGSC 2508]EGO56854.1 hypothetical protein NEUTE1DRAFT_102116 [Neurospora tetrasperma FGSC 2508]EGZ70256.1 hypothetical protein NEUTE2DRAFT_69161 [Neurospora tetrasperma FGSC 2509]
MLDDEHLQGKVSMRAGSNRDGTAPEHDEDFFGVWRDSLDATTQPSTAACGVDDAAGSDIISKGFTFKAPLQVWSHEVTCNPAKHEPLPSIGTYLILTWRSDT